jgi:hypothetical protein
MKLSFQEYGSSIAIEITGNTLEETQILANKLYNAKVLCKPIEEIDTLSVVGLSDEGKLKNLETFFDLEFYLQNGDYVRYSENKGKKKRHYGTNGYGKNKAQEVIDNIEWKKNIIDIEHQNSRNFHTIGNVNGSDLSDSFFE